jgi:transposase
VAPDERDELKREVAELRRENVELRRQLRERDELIAQLQRQLGEALARLSELEERVRQSSRNSGKPPSSDTPAQEAERAERRRAAAKITRAGEPRKPGGQPGHRKFSRVPAPAAQVDERYHCVPELCERCRRRLHGRDSNPYSHQVWHLPLPRPRVSEYLRHALTCSDCQHVTLGKLPAGVPTGAFGPSVVAAVVFLMGVCRLGKRTVQTVLEDMFGLPISLGAVIGCQKLGSSALEPCVEQARIAARKASTKHADETSWREGPGRAKVWLWTLVTSTVTVFAIHRERSTRAARELLGRVGGVLVSDRFEAYSSWRLWMRQLCWSHLIRDFVAIAERGGESARLGDALLGEARRLFAWWHRIRDGTLSRSTFQVYVRTLQNRVRALLEQGRACAQPKTARTCAKMLAVFPAFWRFVEHPGLQPTNNSAEQALRHAVLWRKSSGGTHSELGSRFVERILTVVATLKQQDRNILAFLHQACQAKLSGSESPSLLSASATTPQLAKAA